MPRPPHIQVMQDELFELRAEIATLERRIAMARVQEAALVHRIHEAEEIESW